MKSGDRKKKRSTRSFTFFFFLFFFFSPFIPSLWYSPQGRSLRSVSCFAFVLMWQRIEPQNHHLPTRLLSLQSGTHSELHSISLFSADQMPSKIDQNQNFLSLAWCHPCPCARKRLIWGHDLYRVIFKKVLFGIFRIILVSKN